MDNPAKRIIILLFICVFFISIPVFSQEDHEWELIKDAVALEDSIPMVFTIEEH